MRRRHRWQLCLVSLCSCLWLAWLVSGCGGGGGAGGEVSALDSRGRDAPAGDGAAQDAGLAEASLIDGAGDGASQDSGPPAAVTVEAVVGASGASIELPGGGFLDIAPGTLSADTSIRVTTITRPADPRFVARGQFYRFEPAGLTFPAGVSVSFPLVSSGSAAGSVAVAWTGEDGTLWPLPSTVDATGSRVSAAVPHFSEGGPASDLDVACCEGTTCSVKSHGECNGPLSWGQTCSGIDCANPACCSKGHRYYLAASAAECAAGGGQLLSDPALCAPVCCQKGVGGGLSYTTMPAGICQGYGGLAHPVAACNPICCLVRGIFSLRPEMNCQDVNGEKQPAEQCAKVCCQVADVARMEMKGDCAEEGGQVVDAQQCDHPSCSQDSDCPAHPRPCYRYVCHEHKCFPEVDGGKTCDDGDDCTIDDQCQWEANGGLCKGKPKCTSAIQCTRPTCKDGVCGLEPAGYGAPCDDGKLCTAPDTCDADGQCKGSPVDCRDQNECTSDSCSEANGGCVNQPQAGKACDDGNPCTERDACDADGRCGGSAKDCSDGNPCTDDGCNQASGECTHQPLSGQACVTAAGSPGICVSGVCVPPGGCGADANCDDKNPCTIDVCENEKCKNLNQDWIDCTAAGGEPGRCMGGRCVPTKACNGDADCRDDNECTVDFCRDGKCNYGTYASSHPCTAAGGKPGQCAGSLCVPTGCSNDSECDTRTQCYSDKCEGGHCTHSAADGTSCLYKPGVTGICKGGFCLNQSP